MTVTQAEVRVSLRVPHRIQAEFIDCTAKRIVIRAGRRSGKTTGVAQRAVKRFLAGRRQLYGTPTKEQLEAFWWEVTQMLHQPVEAGILYKNETEHIIEQPRTKVRIKAKTCWNADTLRGDFADDLYLDEYQLMNEDTWEVVGQPMLLDNDGDAVFVYTPPSLESSGVSKAKDPRHTSKLFLKGQADTTGRWKTFHFTSHDNPYISQVALAELTKDMIRAAYRREILAEDDDLDISDLVYGGFDERTQLVDPFALPREWPRYVGHDFGMANPAALFVAHDPKANTFWVYDEYLPGPGKSMFEHSNVFKERTEGLIVLRRVGGNLNTEDEIRQGYMAHGWPIMAPRWKPNVQFARVIGLMERNQIGVFKTCTRYLDELRNCLWEKGPDGTRRDKVKDEARYHLCAAARSVFSEFTPETVSSYNLGHRSLMRAVV